ncbi:MAG: DUF2141 domain-containing protein [Cyclobacteriaceae bacterium]|nr:DUF2141 domain-containing protein [Cyclobacteriaceae bacterium]
MRLLSFLPAFLLLFAGFNFQTEDFERQSPLPAGPVSTSPPTYKISITVTHIRNRNGVIRFKFFDDKTPFPHDLGIRKVVVPKTQVVNDTLRITCEGFISQPMAIALLDDENNNCELDFGWFLPKEGHAFSDYYHTALRRPVYEDFRFILTGDREVTMRMKYY